MNIGLGFIFKLVLDLRWDFNSLSFMQNHFMIVKDHRPLAIENIKELTCDVVNMHHFRTPRRDTLLNNAHIITLEQMPAITNLSPNIIFRIFNRNYHRSPTGSTNLIWIATNEFFYFSTNILRKKSLSP